MRRGHLVSSSSQKTQAFKNKRISSNSLKCFDVICQIEIYVKMVPTLISNIWADISWIFHKLVCSLYERIWGLNSMFGVVNIISWNARQWIGLSLNATHPKQNALRFEYLSGWVVEGSSKCSFRSHQPRKTSGKLLTIFVSLNKAGQWSPVTLNNRL